VEGLGEPFNLLNVCYAPGISVVFLLVQTDTALALIPPSIYYSRVGLELARIIFRGQQMSPPYAVNAQTAHALFR
jgi:hypothetical protein